MSSDIGSVPDLNMKCGVVVNILFVAVPCVLLGEITNDEVTCHILFCEQTHHIVITTSTGTRSTTRRRPHVTETDRLIAVDTRLQGVVVRTP